MTDSRTTILQALATFGEIHNRKISEPLIQVWVNLFESKDTVKLQRAFSEHLERSSYFPKPADINALLNGTFGSRSLAAWSSVIKAMEDHGSFASIRFEDPHVCPIIKSLGGWPYLCAQTHADMVWLEKSFHIIYQDALTAGRTYSDTPYLAGTTEMGNTSFDEAPLIHLVTMDGSTPSSMPALGQASPDEDTTKAVRALATDKGTKGEDKGDQ